MGDIISGLLAVKAAIDTIRSISGLLQERRPAPEPLPVYRLVPRESPPAS